MDYYKIAKADIYHIDVKGIIYEVQIRTYLTGNISVIFDDDLIILPDTLEIISKSNDIEYITKILNCE